MNRPALALVHPNRVVQLRAAADDAQHLNALQVMRWMVLVMLMISGKRKRKREKER